MNNWLKIGVPLLIAVLLVVASVGITIASTRDNSGKQLTTAAYNEKNGDAVYAQAGSCPNCPGYKQGNNAGGSGSGQGYGYRSNACQGRCGDSDDQANSPISGGFRGGCGGCLR